MWRIWGVQYASKSWSLVMSVTMWVSYQTLAAVVVVVTQPVMQKRKRTDSTSAMRVALQHRPVVVWKRKKACSLLITCVSSESAQGWVKITGSSSGPSRSPGGELRLLSSQKYHQDVSLGINTFWMGFGIRRDSTDHHQLFNRVTWPVVEQSWKLFCFLFFLNKLNARFCNFFLFLWCVS